MQQDFQVLPILGVSALQGIDQNVVLTIQLPADRSICCTESAAVVESWRISLMEFEGMY
jgi:hypothetical protein